jgi:hypothetical protein
MRTLKCEKMYAKEFNEIRDYILKQQGSIILVRDKKKQQKR